MPPPSPYDLHNRLTRAEAALRAVEKALDALFRKLNVNRKRDPELDAVIETLAAIRHGLDHARGDRSKDVEPEPEPYEISLSAETATPDDSYTPDDEGGRELAAVVPFRLKEN